MYNIICIYNITSYLHCLFLYPWDMSSNSSRLRRGPQHLAPQLRSHEGGHAQPGGVPSGHEQLGAEKLGPLEDDFPSMHLYII